MKNVRLTLLVSAIVLSLCTSVLAGGDKGKGKSPKASGNEPNAPSKPLLKSESEKAKEPWLSVKVDISSDEREIISAYVHSRTGAEGRGHKPKELPPGLAKKVARGGDLPPGWQKKCVRGEIMPLEVYKHCHPLPREVAIKLPPAPPGTILIAVEGKVVRLAKATREILDVFDVL